MLERESLSLEFVRMDLKCSNGISNFTRIFQILQRKKRGEQREEYTKYSPMTMTQKAILFTGELYIFILYLLEFSFL